MARAPPSGPALPKAPSTVSHWEPGLQHMDFGGDTETLSPGPKRALEQEDAQRRKVEWGLREEGQGVTTHRVESVFGSTKNSGGG